MLGETTGRLRASTALVLSAALFAGGCNAKWNTAFRQNSMPPDRPSAITTDAKQRHVLMQPEFEGDRATKMRMCAEPSPDVFAAIAASGSAAIGVDAKSQSGTGSFGMSAAETAATIERTQTINLLRESFFRTCERYLSGAISKESFIVQAGRDSRAMVAVLAIEQLTGAVRRPSTIISGPGTSASAQLPSQLVELYAAAAQRRADAEKAYEPLKGKEKEECDKKPADQKPACESDKAKAVAAKAELDAANARVAEIMKLSGNVGAGAAGGASAGTQAGTNNPGGSTDKPSPTDVATVAASVQAIATKMIEIDDMRLFCIEKYLTLTDAQLREACLGLLSEAARSEAGSLRAAIKSPEIRRQADVETAARQAARTDLLAFLPRSTDRQYASLRGSILTFCRTIDRIDCRTLIESGALDTTEAQVINTALTVARAQ